MIVLINQIRLETMWHFRNPFVPMGRLWARKLRKCSILIAPPALTSALMMDTDYFWNQLLCFWLYFVSRFTVQLLQKCFMAPLILPLNKHDRVKISMSSSEHYLGECGQCVWIVKAWCHQTIRLVTLTKCHALTSDWLSLSSASHSVGVWSPNG